MAKKVFKGWCSKQTNPCDIDSISTIEAFVTDTKPEAAAYWQGMKDYWPPRRVTVTIEVED